MWYIRNSVAIVIVLVVSGTIMHVPWPKFFSDLGMADDPIIIALCAGMTGGVAAMIGNWSSSIWYLAWLLGISGSHMILDPPDPQWQDGLILHALMASPILLSCLITNWIKQYWVSKQIS